MPNRAATPSTQAGEPIGRPVRSESRTAVSLSCFCSDHSFARHRRLRSASDGPKAGPPFTPVSATVPPRRFGRRPGRLAPVRPRPTHRVPIGGGRVSAVNRVRVDFELAIFKVHDPVDGNSDGSKDDCLFSVVLKARPGNLHDQTDGRRLGVTVRVLLETANISPLRSSPVEPNHAKPCRFHCSESTHELIDEIAGETLPSRHPIHRRLHGTALVARCLDLAKRRYCDSLK